jgi:hypothetical protein
VEAVCFFNEKKHTYIYYFLSSVISGTIRFGLMIFYVVITVVQNPEEAKI